MTYAGIIFDFNGVLWWDAPIVIEGWQRSAQQLRGRPFSDEEIVQLVHGRNNRDTLEYLAGRKLGGEEAAQLIEEREEFYRSLCLKQGDAFRLSPGAEGLLEYLRGRGIPRTIATASIRVNVEFFVQQLRLERWFEPQKIVIDDGTLRSKPAPDYYLKAAANLQLDPSRCIVVEDAVSGIRAARAAGIGWVIGLKHESTEGARLDIPADEWIGDLGRLDRNKLFGE